jgi:TolB-like protein/Tfp pilus assembly protein PilF
MFTDIKDYTALMQLDEKIAMEARSKHRKIFNTVTQKYHGTILQYYGDGTLSIFDSATDAVQCAIDIQKELQKPPLIPVRIGIHSGEVIFSEEEVVGDGVNIASRIEAIAKAGSIIISEKVYDEIKNQRSILARSIGIYEFKNVFKPIEVFAIVDKLDEVKARYRKPQQAKNNVRKIILAIFGIALLIAILGRNWIFNSAALQEDNFVNSIAILPFDNMSGDPDQEYFSDGISEEILNILAQMEELKVAGRTSSFSFKGTQADIQTIGEKLNVNLILEGSVRRSGDRIRITVQLIKSSDGYHLWSETYDTEWTDLFAIQDDIASRIAEKLNITLSLGSQEKGPAAPTINMEAHELLLKGNYFLVQRVDGVEKALQYYTEAIRIDPLYAEAYMQLSLTYYWLTALDFIPPKEGFPKCREMAEKALSLDEKLIPPHGILAWVQLHYDWNWKLAMEKFEEVQKNQPDVPHFFLSWYAAMIDTDFDHAISITEQIVQADPLNLWALTNLAHIKILARDYNGARKVLNTILELKPTFSEGYRYLGLTYFYENQYDKAIEYLQRAADFSHGKGSSLFYLVCANAAAGKRQAAEEIYQVYLNTASRITPWKKGIIASYFGNNEQAFSLLDQSYNERDYWLITLKADPVWDIIRSDARFQQLLQKMEFPN